MHFMVATNTDDVVSLREQQQTTPSLPRLCTPNRATTNYSSLDAAYQSLALAESSIFKLTTQRFASPRHVDDDAVFVYRYQWSKRKTGSSQEKIIGPK